MYILFYMSTLGGTQTDGNSTLCNTLATVAGEITEVNYLQSVKNSHPELTHVPSIQIVLAIENYMATFNFKWLG